MLTQSPELDHLAKEHVEDKFPMKPGLHVGTHVIPVTEPEVQFPAVALPMAGRPEHLELTQVPLLYQIALVHVEDNCPKKSVLHAGVHVVLLTEFSVQSPAPALVILGSAIHVELAHDPVEYQVALVQVAERVP